MSESRNERSLDPQLWRACAGRMVEVPPVDSKVYYFPQGHAEHVSAPANFALNRRVPPMFLCRVAGVKLLADPATDEVFAKMNLVPLPREREREPEEDGFVGIGGKDKSEKPSFFAKILTQSDANNGGGFSVPRYCADTIFPQLDYTADPPVQTLKPRDVHGEVWTFRHIYRGTPRRHLLTTGWSVFVNKKKLIAGDSIVFSKADNGEICVGIRRAKRGFGYAPAHDSGWANGGHFPPSLMGLPLAEEENDQNGHGFGNSSPIGDNGGAERGRVEAVMEAVTLAANGQPFEVVYYPRAGTTEFCVKASAVRKAMRTQWYAGMRFKMAIEAEDASRISFSVGIISSVEVADPVNWPGSPWRLLQVTWDDPESKQNLRRVNPWLVEVESTMPIIDLASFSPPRKKLRLPQHSQLTIDDRFPVSSILGNPLGPSNTLCYRLDSTPAGIQGARHVLSGASLTDLLSNQLQTGIFPPGFQQSNQHSIILNGVSTIRTNGNGSLSCLPIGNSSQKSEKPDDVKSLEKPDGVKRRQILLFGQNILTEEQISKSCSENGVPQVSAVKISADEDPDKAKVFSNGSKPTLGQEASPEKSSPGLPWFKGLQATEFAPSPGLCKVFVEAEDIKQTLDLSVIGSYEELYKKLVNMLGTERSEVMSHVLYLDAIGALKRTGDEPFSDFMKTAKRLTILTDSASKNTGRPWSSGKQNTETDLAASNKEQ
ncbi:hypothetical protein UlMin_028850, partial [Ulmus minor]